MLNSFIVERDSFNSPPLVSVIVPVYCVEGYIERCAQSLFEQTYEHVEYLFIDDCSPDNSIRLLQNQIEKYSSRRQQVRIIRHDTNQGVAATRNDGLDESKGQLLCFIDGDDYIHPRMIEVMVDALTPDTDFVMTWGKTTMLPDEPHIEVIPPVQTLSCDDLMGGIFGTADQEIQYQVVWNKLIPKSKVNDIRFRQITGEDADFAMRLYLRSSQVALVPCYLYYYCQRPDSVTHGDVNDKYQITRERFIQNIDTYYDCYKYIPETNKKYKAWCLWKMYKRMMNVRFMADTTPFRQTARQTIKRIKELTWHDAMTNPYMGMSKKWIIRLLYHFPALYRLMMWWNNRK